MSPSLCAFIFWLYWVVSWFEFVFHILNYRQDLKWSNKPQEAVVYGEFITAKGRCKAQTP